MLKFNIKDKLVLIFLIKKRQAMAIYCLIIYKFGYEEII
tara:strand:+ start:373 stop:489 length:117 start_codon:yes stop_codon:yes gene_type:complete